MCVARKHGTNTERHSKTRYEDARKRHEEAMQRHEDVTRRQSTGHGPKAMTVRKFGRCKGRDPRVGTSWETSETRRLCEGPKAIRGPILVTVGTVEGFADRNEEFKVPTLNLKP